MYVCLPSLLDRPGPLLADFRNHFRFYRSDNKHQHTKLLLLVFTVLIVVISRVSEASTSSSGDTSLIKTTIPTERSENSSSSDNDSVRSFTTSSNGVSIPFSPIPNSKPPRRPLTFQVAVLHDADTQPTTPPMEVTTSPNSSPKPARSTNSATGDMLNSTTTVSNGTASNSAAASIKNDGKPGFKPIAASMTTSPPSNSPIAKPAQPVSKLSIPISTSERSAPIRNGYSTAMTLSAPGETEGHSGTIDGSSQDEELTLPTSTIEQEHMPTTTEATIANTSTTSSPGSSDIVENDVGSLNDFILNGSIDSRKSILGSFEGGNGNVEDTGTDGSIKLSTEIGSEGDAHQHTLETSAPSAESSNEKGDAQQDRLETNAGSRAATTMLLILIVIAHAVP